MTEFETLSEKQKQVREQVLEITYSQLVEEYDQENFDHDLYREFFGEYLDAWFTGVTQLITSDFEQIIKTCPERHQLIELTDNFSVFNPIFYLYYEVAQNEDFLFKKIENKYSSMIDGTYEGKKWRENLWNKWIVQSFTEQIVCILLLRYCLSIESDYTPKILEIYSDLAKVNIKATQKRCDREGDILLAALLMILREDAISDESLQIVERALGMAVRRDAYNEVSMISKDVVMIVAWLLLNDQKKLNTFTDIFPYIHGLADKVQIKSEHTGKIL